MNILEGVRIIEIADEIAGPYCGKLFADVGAEVIKVESPDGDRFRRRGSRRRAGTDGALFTYLNAGKRSVLEDYGDQHLRDLIASADILIDSGVSGSIDHGELHSRSPHLVIATISNFGLTGPYRDKPATEFTLQAESGTMGLRARPDQPPLQVGGRVFEWVLGSYAAVGALAAFLRARQGGGGEVIDCSLMEACHLSASGFIDLYYALAGSPQISGPSRMTELPSIEPTADGWVGFNTNTRQQFESFLLMIESYDLLERDASWALALTRYERMEEWNNIVRDWTVRHTTEEIVELASALRIPVAQVNNGQTVLDHPHFNARGIWAASADGSFTHPLPPYRIDGTRPGSEPKFAPRLGELDATALLTKPGTPRTSVSAGNLPLAGTRIIDATAWWAGPSSTHILAALGADVVHLESVQHPDGARMTAGAFMDQPSWWERSAMFLATNANKKGLTLDLSSPRGRELFFRLVENADVVVENFSPRVFENFGLTWEALSAVNPRLIMTRMPAFGLDGPWRDNVGFAQTMEQMTGMAWVTGHEYDQPRIPRGPCDPLAGMHSAFAILVGLSRREQTGRGSFVEVSMVEAALNAAAEQVIEYTAYGTILSRLGNRSRDAAPQGLYPCRGHEQWLALSIASDEQWSALKTVLGQPDWADDPSLDTHEGRWRAHDLIDKHLEQWASGQESTEAAAILSASGVPASSLYDARLSPQHPQMVARGYFERLNHSIVGQHQVPTIPFRFRSVDRWCRSPAPTVGEHNETILKEWLGLDESAIETLMTESVIGARLKGID
ncbi:cag pathogenicity island protein [Mycobacterium colombiense]|uniref:Cag pathogenicity island protein n=1 Tax=Mycobacterium colombiense TaxID=339268 RepID=A0A1A2SLJ3_9MYCO|nr:CoA transferase [Mycobacterium colombiense]OBH64935.1 cag pathogenicity island protein [Mycobacterium colombiense]